MMDLWLFSETKLRTKFDTIIPLIKVEPPLELQFPGIQNLQLYLKEFLLFFLS